MKCKQYGRCSNFYDTECSGEDGSTPIACSHFSKIDLTTVPTPDLVRELEKRERDCQCIVCISKNMTFTGSIRDIERDIGFQIPGSYGTIQGPAKIIVVRGDE